jgi:ammonium transporter, Amt family
VHVMAMNFMIYGLGMLGFWICGFAIMFGGWWHAPVPIGWEPTLGQGLTVLNGEFSILLFGKPFGLMGYKGFFLNPSVFDTAVFCLFLFQMVFMDTTATIPTGAMAERWNFKNFFIYGFWVSMFGYAIFGNWVWGGGWLAQLGVNFDLGHGHVDFAGSSVVHLSGGIIALAGTWVLGPRHGQPGEFRAHNIPMAMLGTFILAFGWCGFNSGSTLSGTDHRIAIVAVNTMLASASGAAAATLLMWGWRHRYGTPEPTMMCNGMLAGLVAITAPCAFVGSLSAVIIGSTAGVLVVVAASFVEQYRLKIDDPVGAISVHGVCGLWGVISLGIFADGSYGKGWNGVHKLVKDGVVQIIHNNGAPDTMKKHATLITSGWSDQGVTGCLGTWFGGAYNDISQLFAQCIGAVTCIIFVGCFALVWFKFSNRWFPIRSLDVDQVEGLDTGELRTRAYIP